MVKNIEVCSVCSKGGGEVFLLYKMHFGGCNIMQARARPFLLSLALNYFNTEYKTSLCL